MQNLIKILVVEDDLASQKLAGAILKKYGEIDIVHNGLSAIDKIITKQYDIILLDVNLGLGMNGIETLDKIKSINPDIPVVMLSSQDKIDVAVNCIHHKAYDYVVKSETSFMRLQRKINTLFNFREVEKELGWYMERM